MLCDTFWQDRCTRNSPHASFKFYRFMFPLERHLSRPCSPDMCHSKPSGHGKEQPLCLRSLSLRKNGRPRSPKFSTRKRWVHAGPPCLYWSPMWKVFFEWPGHHFRCLLLIGKVSPGCTSWIAPIRKIQTCLVHHSGSLLRTKSSAYVLELERAMISKASKLGSRKEDSALIFVTC